MDMDAHGDLETRAVVREEDTGGSNPTDVSSPFACAAFLAAPGVVRNASLAATVRGAHCDEWSSQLPSMAHRRAWRAWAASGRQLGLRPAAVCFRKESALNWASPADTSAPPTTVAADPKLVHRRRRLIA